MGFWNKYPHSSLTELNLDWILGVTKRMEDALNGDLAPYIRDQLDELLANATYDPDTETIILTISEGE